jgi:hypothetical protein
MAGDLLEVAAVLITGADAQDMPVKSPQWQHLSQVTRRTG